MRRTFINISIHDLSQTKICRTQSRWLLYVQRTGQQHGLQQWVISRLSRNKQRIYAFYQAEFKDLTRLYVQN